MAMSILDPRTGGTCVNFVAKKSFSYVVGYVQLIIWVIRFFTLIFHIFHASSVANVVKNVGTTSMIITGFLVLFCIAFSVVLLIGLHKDRRLYVKTYFIYVIVHLVLMVIAIIINIVVQPKRIGFNGFFFLVMSIFLNLFYFYVVRCYYLITYCNGSNQLISNEPKV